VTFASTGAEAVEAAVKHAELEASRRNDELLRTQEQVFQRLRGLPEITRTDPQGLLVAASKRFDVRIESFDHLFKLLRQTLTETLSRPPVFLAVEGSFHGKTTGALQLTHRDDFRRPWRRIGLSVEFLPRDDETAVGAAIERQRLTYPALVLDSNGLAALKERSLVNIAACFVEPIQGEGGIHELGSAFLTALRGRSRYRRIPIDY
jgi:acetylornithine/succinyldiaminopimelate/putrescine aminotransferase